MPSPDPAQHETDGKYDKEIEPEIGELHRALIAVEQRQQFRQFGPGKLAVAAGELLDPRDHFGADVMRYSGLFPFDAL